MITSAIKHNKSRSDFPCIMLHTESKQIVLFEKAGVGTRVYSQVNASTIGYHSRSWHMGDFESFTGTLEIKNKEPK